MTERNLLYDAVLTVNAGLNEGRSTARTRSAKRAPRPKPVGTGFWRDRRSCADRLVARVSPYLSRNGSPESVKKYPFSNNNELPFLVKKVAKAFSRSSQAVRAVPTNPAEDRVNRF